MAWRMPAEWEPQEAVWLVWPRDPMTWPDRLDAVRRAYLAAMADITPHQRVELVVHPELAKAARAHTAAAGLGNVVFHEVEHQDSWIRDYGPTYVVDDVGGRRAIKWRFNAWGNKYESLLADDAVVHRLGAAVQSPIDEVGIVLEGGSIDVDGQGTLLTTEQCLLNPNRNPTMDRDSLERILHDRLGVAKTLWLGDGIQGDDTDGHVDDVARFLAPGVVAAATCSPDHPDHEALAANLNRLRSASDALGRRLRVVEIPMPEPMHADEEPLPASHLNFLITNGCVLVPTFGGASDATALRAMEPFFPDRRVVGLDSRDLVWGMGSIHCLSQQVPRAKGFIQNLP